MKGELVGARMLIIKSHKKFNCLSFELLFFLPPPCSYSAEFSDKFLARKETRKFW